jgi:hypothetical protein
VGPIVTFTMMTKNFYKIQKAKAKAENDTDNDIFVQRKILSKNDTRFVLDDILW